MKMQEHLYTAHVEAYDGFCRKCDEITNFGDVEPDARNRSCDECGEQEVFGVEQAMLMGIIEIEED